jgi:hypothetical protein
VQNARKNVLLPANINYGDSRAEVGLQALIVHSTARILEFLLEVNAPQILGLTETEKASLELWGKVGTDRETTASTCRGTSSQSTELQSTASVMFLFS